MTITNPAVNIAITSPRSTAIVCPVVMASVVAGAQKPVGRRSPSESGFARRGELTVMISGSTCPECGGHVQTQDGLGYVCTDCGTEFDVADLFVH
ncbi:hypothetical protein C451_08636 [Halococcus thailandensis JCM 13552]|uniref:Uncharacterized protein n=1 Tax=Halococcus thailandensis JCM 13552 TaxID=1227457 RepID=M0N7H0_9EURY|nr:hypothetical protein C451_08636 [Halococcus thailandensis JCM 13552]